MTSVKSVRVRSANCKCEYDLLYHSHECDHVEHEYEVRHRYVVTVVLHCNYLLSGRIRLKAHISVSWVLHTSMYLVVINGDFTVELNVRS